MASGVVLLPGRERQTAIQQGLPWLYPRLQAEFPGDPDSLSPLHFGEIEKVWWQGFKNGQIISCIDLSEGRLYVFLCGGFLPPWRSYRGQNQHFYKRKKGAQLLGSSEGCAPFFYYMFICSGCFSCSMGTIKYFDVNVIGQKTGFVIKSLSSIKRYSS